MVTSSLYGPRPGAKTLQINCWLTGWPVAKAYRFIHTIMKEKTLTVDQSIFRSQGSYSLWTLMNSRKMKEALCWLTDQCNADFNKRSRHKAIYVQNVPVRVQKLWTLFWNFEGDHKENWGWIIKCKTFLHLLLFSTVLALIRCLDWSMLTAFYFAL